MFSDRKELGKENRAYLGALCVGAQGTLRIDEVDVETNVRFSNCKITTTRGQSMCAAWGRPVPVILRLPQIRIIG